MVVGGASEDEGEMDSTHALSGETESTTLKIETPEMRFIDSPSSIHRFS